MRKARSGRGLGTCGKYERTPEIRAKISQGVTQAYLDGRLKGYPANGRGEWVESEKADEEVWAHSSWERRVLNVLDLHPCVQEVQVEPFAITYEYEGSTHRYLPDFLITLEGGIQELWEVKPAMFLEDPKTKAKLEAFHRYVDEHDLNGRIVNLHDIEGMEMQVGIRPWEGPGRPWVRPDDPNYRPRAGDY
jgi:hypothetical protein